MVKARLVKEGTSRRLLAPGQLNGGRPARELHLKRSSMPSALPISHRCLAKLITIRLFCGRGGITERQCQALPSTTEEISGREAVGHLVLWTKSLQSFPRDTTSERWPGRK